jgi:hypothetical protein
MVSKQLSIEFEKNSQSEMALKILTTKLKKLLYRFEILNELCLSLNEAAQRTSYCAYITFDNEYSYIQCLEKLQNLGLLTYMLQQKKYKMDGQTVFIKVSLYVYVLVSMCWLFFIYILRYYTCVL